MLAHHLAAVVRRVVEQPVSVFPPVTALLSQQHGQSRHEHQHDVTVRIELRQAQVELAFGIDSSDHVNTVA